MNHENLEGLAVLIPVYNDHEGLAVSLAAIREEDTSFTVVVVDDGSAEPVNIEPERYDFEVVVLRNEPNGGIVSALNTGLDYIRTKGFSCVARLDAADLNRPGRLAQQFQLLAANPNVSMVGSNASFRCSESGAELLRTKLPLSPEGVRKWMVFRNCFIHPTVMIHLGRVSATLCYRERFRHIEDYVLFSEVAAEHDCVNIPEVLVDCFVRESGISRKNDRAQLLAGVRHHLANPKPFNPLWYAYLAKRTVYLTTPYRWRNRIKQLLGFVQLHTSPTRVDRSLLPGGEISEQLPQTTPARR